MFSNQSKQYPRPGHIRTCRIIQKRIETEQVDGMEYLDEDRIKKYEAEIGMGRGNVKNDLDLIRNWVNQQPHLPELEDNEETNGWLYNFLFHSKNRVELVKQHLEAYFTYRSLMPEFFIDRNPEAEGIKANVRALYLITLPKLTPEGYRIHIFRHALSDPSAYEPRDFMRRALMMCDWKMKKDLTTGDIIIMHMTYSSLAHWGRYNLLTLSRFVAAVTKAYQVRIKAVHFLEAPSFLSQVINNPFIPSKLKERIKIHPSGDLTTCLAEIPKDCLPVELGGTLNATLDELNEMTYRNLIDLKAWFREGEKLKSDESKRMGDLKENPLFGSEGTFRTLELD